MSFHLPVIKARPGSVVASTSPVVLFLSQYSGMSGVRLLASARPMFNAMAKGGCPRLESCGTSCKNP